MSLVVAFLLLAEPPEQLAGPPRFKVADIVFRIEDIEGAVKSLEVKETDTEVRIELAADVLFDFDKSDILPKAEQTLTQVGDMIRERGTASVRIEGHTDSKGNDAYNQRLSLARAQSVADWLGNEQGLAEVEYSVDGFGEKRPIAENTRPDGSDDPEGRQKNRRVEIVLKKR
jgi:outer membrane protein OmpA-like peptidoglycan-associated protein